MQNTIERRVKKIGLPPGSLVHFGDKNPAKVKIKIFDYAKDTLIEKEAKSIEECIPFKEKPTVTWVNVIGLHQTELLDKLGKGFGIHPLIMEDILTTGQRPKIEDFQDHIYIVFNNFQPNGAENKIITEQISIVLGVNFVITFQERDNGIFSTLQERIRKGGQVRHMGADYLAYRVLDVIVDNYFLVLDKFNVGIEKIEEDVIRKDDPKMLMSVQAIKRNLIHLRQSLWPLRDLVGQLSKGEISMVRDTTEIYLRDVYDHITQAIDSVETFRDILSGVSDIYLTNASNKMNAVIKVLTIISTIFMPLNLLAGIYGMNFSQMPGLDQPIGFPVLIMVMLLVSAGMLFYFRKRSWL